MTRYGLLQLQLGGLLPVTDFGVAGAVGDSSGSIDALAELYDMALHDVLSDVAKWYVK